MYKQRAQSCYLKGSYDRPHYGSCLSVRLSIRRSAWVPNSKTKRRRETKIGTNIPQSTSRLSDLPIFSSRGQRLGGLLHNVCRHMLLVVCVVLLSFSYTTLIKLSFTYTFASGQGLKKWGSAPLCGSEKTFLTLTMVFAV